MDARAHAAPFRRPRPHARLASLICLAASFAPVADFSTGLGIPGAVRVTTGSSGSPSADQAMSPSGRHVVAAWPAPTGVRVYPADPSGPGAMLDTKGEHSDLAPCAVDGGCTLAQATDGAAGPLAVPPFRFDENRPGAGYAAFGAGDVQEPWDGVWIASGAAARGRSPALRVPLGR